MARMPIARKLAEQMIQEYAAGQALMIRTVFASPSPAKRTRVRLARLIRHRSVRSGHVSAARAAP